MASAAAAQTTLGPALSPARSGPDRPSAAPPPAADQGTFTWLSRGPRRGRLASCGSRRPAAATPLSTGSPAITSVLNCWYIERRRLKPRSQSKHRRLPCSVPPGSVGTGERAARSSPTSPVPPQLPQRASCPRTAMSRAAGQLGGPGSLVAPAEAVRGVLQPVRQQPHHLPVTSDDDHQPTTRVAADCHVLGETSPDRRWQRDMRLFAEPRHRVGGQLRHVVEDLSAEESDHLLDGAPPPPRLAIHDRDLVEVLRVAGPRRRVMLEPVPPPPEAGPPWPRGRPAPRW